MATAQIPDASLLESIVDRIVRRLPYEAAWTLAEAPPIEAGKDDPIGDLARLLQARCRRRIDEPDYNEETRRAIEETRAGRGLIRFDNLDAMLADLKSDD